MEDLLLGFRLPVFTKRAKREPSVHPKFYFFDAGVFRSLRPRGPLDSAVEIDGHALEGLVAQHLRACLVTGLKLPTRRKIKPVIARSGFCDEAISFYRR